MTTFFYNNKGIGDVLIVDLLKNKEGEVKIEQYGDWTVIKEGTSDQLAGLNLFKASSYFNGLTDTNGKWVPSKEEVEQLHSLLKEAGLDVKLEIDPRPDFLIGYIEKKESHPDADKLSVCEVNLGEETVQIVCGAPNVEAGQKVVVARVGALMPDGTVIKDAELRGVPSSGMICSARELQLPNAPQKKGIHVLPEEAPLGESFWTYHDQLLTSR